MEPTPGKESVVARLFGFGRKRRTEETPPVEGPEETGFARTDAESVDEDPQVTIPEQVIRSRTPAKRSAKDEAVSAITDSFRELTGLLGSVTERLDRQDTRATDLADQLTELPEYLRTLPRLQQEQTDALKGIGDVAGARGRWGEEQSKALRELSMRVTEGSEAVAGALRRLPEVQEEQSRAVHVLGERMAESTEAVHGLADGLAKIPEEFRQHAQMQEEAIRQVASAQQQTAKVIYAGNQKTLQLFHQATQKTLQTAQKQALAQQEQMEDLLHASISNMKRMFVLAAAFMGAALIGVIALLWLR